MVRISRFATRFVYRKPTVRWGFRCSEECNVPQTAAFQSRLWQKNGLYEKHAPACGRNTPATPPPATPATGAATSTTTKCHLSQRRGHPIQPQTAVLTDSHSGQAAVNTYTADKHHRGLRSAKEKRTRRGQSGLSLLVDVET